MKEMLKKEDVLSAIHSCDQCKDKCNLSDIINRIPTVDAVEIVKCKDCVHRYHSTFFDDYFCEIDFIRDCTGEKLPVDDDFSCRYGQRKDESDAE